MSSSIKCHIGVQLACLDITSIIYSKGQSGHWNGISTNILAFLLYIHTVDIIFLQELIQHINMY